MTERNICFVRTAWHSNGCAQRGIRCALFRFRWPFGRLRSAARTRERRKQCVEQKRDHRWNDVDILSRVVDAQARQMTDKRARSHTHTRTHNKKLALHTAQSLLTAERLAWAVQQSDQWCGRGFIVELRRRDFNSSRYSRLACPLAQREEIFIFIDDFVHWSPAHSFLRLFFFFLSFEVAVVAASNLFDFAMKWIFPLFDHLNIWMGEWSWAEFTQRLGASATTSTATTTTTNHRQFKATNPTNSIRKLLKNLAVVPCNIRPRTWCICPMRDAGLLAHLASIDRYFIWIALITWLCTLRTNGKRTKTATTAQCQRKEIKQQTKCCIAFILLIVCIESHWIMTIINVSSREMRIHWTRIIYLFSPFEVRTTYRAHSFFIAFSILHLHGDEMIVLPGYRVARGIHCDLFGPSLSPVT